MKISGLFLGIAGLISTVAADLPSASEALSVAGIQGGFCVVIGTVDGEFEAALAADGREYWYKGWRSLKALL